MGTNWEHKHKKKRAKYLIYKYLALFLVPRAGVEPARVAPLVFETSASTDSAIWAFLRCKDKKKIRIDKFLIEKT
jgi:hypothetical protein